MKNLFTLLSVLALAFTVSCGSSKKDADGNDLASMNNEGVTDMGGELKLNGTSDELAAGGIATVYFPFDSATITAAARSILDANASYLKSNGGVQVQIEGHCDERGGVQYNLALGEKRARATRDYLVAAGVSSSRITTISYGKERPLDFGHDDAAWARNRRANFLITAK